MRVIRAAFDEKTITVYQAFNPLIAQTAVASQVFVSPPFKKERMTWIKPSFLWMMYRSAWATKENQQHILAMRIKRDGFEWALRNSCLSKFDRSIHVSYCEWKSKMKNSAVRVQWDPERDIFSTPLPHRTIQVGLSGIAVERYVSDWIVEIDDITEQCKVIHQLLVQNKVNQAKALLPNERLYPLPEDIELIVNSY